MTIRPPKPVYDNGIFIGFSVKGETVYYQTWIWTQQGLTRVKAMHGVFNGDVENLLNQTRFLVMENPKEFGYDEDYWMSEQEREKYKPSLPKITKEILT